MIKVLVADDQPLVRAGLRKIFDADSEIEIVGEAVDGLAAVEMAGRMLPDVVVMDIRMPRLDGIEATRRVVASAAAPRVVVLTTFGLDEYVVEALRAGASGFLLKDAPPEDILAAVHTVIAGEALLDPGVTRAVVERVTSIPTPDSALLERLEELTPREREVLELVARGMSNAEIAAELVLGEGTVKTHVARVFSKLGLRDRVQAVIYAYETGVVSAGS